MHLLKLGVCAVVALAAVCGCDSGGSSEGMPSTDGEETFGFRSSPANGESGVATTRESILTFGLPIDASTLSEDALFATSAGERIPASLHLYENRRRVALFFAGGLPGDASIEVKIDGDRIRSESGLTLDGDGDGQPGGTGLIVFDTVSLRPVPETDVCARVFASELDDGGQNRLLEGVRVSVDGASGSIWTETGPDGRFCLEDAPAGRIFVHVDGRTATNAPPNAYYPSVGKAWTSFAGERTDVGLIHLPAIADSTLSPVSRTRDTVVEFSPEQLAMLSDPFIRNSLDGVQVIVPADSLFSDDGARGGSVGIAPVAADRLPGALPGGLNAPLVITVQTDGATNFDEPVSACFMNLPDPVTGLKPEPGEDLSLWSFNHDTGRFEVAARATVDTSGDLACSPPGTGIVAPGWQFISDWVLGRPTGDRAPSGLPADCGEIEIDALVAGQFVGGCLSSIGGIGKLFESVGTISSKLQSLSKAREQFQTAFETFAAGDTRRGELRLAMTELRQAKGALSDLIETANQAQSPLAKAIEVLGCIEQALNAARDACDDIVVNALCAREDDPLVKACKRLPNLADDLGLIKTLFEGANNQLKEVAFSAVCAALDQAQDEIDAPDSDDDALLEDIRDLADKIRGVPQTSHEEDDALDSFIDDLIEYTDDSADAQNAREGDDSSSVVFVEVETGGSAQHLTSSPSGYYETSLPANAYYGLRIYEPLTGRCGANLGRSTPSGEDTVFHGAQLADCPPLDSDGDGLPDLAEEIVGTAIDVADTDGDGVDDGAEILAGTDPGGRSTIELGTLIEGDLASPGETDVWRLVVNEPTRLFLEVVGVVVTQRQLLFTWRGPDGSFLVQSQASPTTPGSGNQPLDALDVGVYTLAITPFLSSDDGSYRFRVHQPVTDERELFVGEPSEGAIERPGDIDRWILDGTAGQELIFNFQDIVGVRETLAWVEFRSPSDALIFGGSVPEDIADLGDFGPFTLTESGPYVLTIGREFLADVYSYRFVMQEQTPSGGGRISFGAAHSGTIESVGETQEWTFDGGMGDRVFLHMMCTDCAPGRTLEITALAPDGSTLFLAASDGTFVLGNKGPVVLPQSGTYRLVLRSSTAGLEYAFVLHAPELDIATVTPGVPVSATLDVPGEVDEWRFAAVAGGRLFLDELSFDATGPLFGPFEYNLFAPSGTAVFEATRLKHPMQNGAQGPVTLPETGTYRLQVRAAPDWPETLSYSFQIDL